MHVSLRATLKQLNDVFHFLRFGHLALGVAELAFYFLDLITRRTEVSTTSQDGVSQPFSRHISAVIELKRKQHLESPPFAAHTSPFP